MATNGTKNDEGRNTQVTIDKIFLLYWLFPLCEMLLIYYYSTKPFTPSSYIKYQDKFLHIIAYASLSLLWANALCYKREAGLSRLAMSIGIASIFGAFVEICQIYSNRFFEWADIVANFLGALLGTFVYSSFMAKSIAKLPSEGDDYGSRPCQ